jgi:hypothetical protein
MRVHGGGLINQPILIFLLAGYVQAQTALEPETAGPDFLIQGEYTGTLIESDDTKDSVAAQVMAMGGAGAFRATLLWGGLPGAGWDKQNKLELPGVTGETSTEFSGEGYTLSILPSGETLEGTGPAGGIISMGKVMRHSSTEGLSAPAGANILFDGTHTDAWVDGKMDERTFLEADTKSVEFFGDITLHLEFRSPFSPEVTYGNRGNSGIYLQSRYECQIYDSFSQQRPLVEADYEGYGIYADGGGGSIYKIAAPDVNMTYPPLSWQTFDIKYAAAEYNGDAIANHPRITVWHNGVLVHEDLELPHSTVSSPLQPGNTDEALFLQGHGSAVFFRNIWLVPESDYPIIGQRGCMDPLYAEYDVNATVHDSAECITLGARKVTLSRSGTTLITPGLSVTITSAGPHSLYIYDLTGELAVSKNGEGPGQYNFTEVTDPGVYILVVRTPQETITRKVIF